MLDPAQLARWHRDGYLAVPGFKTPVELASVRARSLAIVDALDPLARPAVFSTRDRPQLSEQALLASADQVHCFFEEEAFDASGRLRVPKAQAINKIGHALHDRDPVFDRFSRDPALAALAAEVVWHQDASFLYTEPQSVVGFWFALEEATLDNGCPTPAAPTARRSRAWPTRCMRLMPARPTRR